jgi:hypothetical protein
MKERSCELLKQIAKEEGVDEDDIFIAVAEKIDKVAEDTRKNKTWQLISYDPWDRESTLYDEGEKQEMLDQFKKVDAGVMGGNLSVISPAGFCIAHSKEK